MAPSSILVVAPDGDFRESLVFALEEDGYTVTSTGVLPTISWMQENRFRCTVVDQKALTGESYEGIAFCIKAHPVVLLATRPRATLIEWVAQVVETPAPAEQLAAAVAGAIASSGPRVGRSG